MQGNAYYGLFRQRTANGDAADVENCEVDERFVCSEGADDNQFFLRDRTGSPVRTDRLRTFNFGGINPTFATASTRVTLRLPQPDPYQHRQFRRHGPDRDPRDAVRPANASCSAASMTAAAPASGRQLHRRPDPRSRLLAPRHRRLQRRRHHHPRLGPHLERLRRIYFSNNTDLTDRLTLTLQGRFNMAKIVLRDQIARR